ncbi:MAG: TetR/AcrR family transcriptional regulator [Clostridiaceae bacterium]|nr:TetR/AcrR family transcriptional regulator [Clostridiaceae bacterium]
MLDGEKTDRRVRFTKLSLRTALLSMLRERPIEKITVSALCDRADVGRGTFYMHYRDCFDLLEQIEGELYEQIRVLLSRQLVTSPAMRDTLVLIIDCIAKNVDLCAVIFTEHGDMRFLKRVLDLAYGEFPAKTADARYELLFAVNGAVGVIREWVAGGLRETPARIADLIWRLSRGDLR